MLNRLESLIRRFAAPLSLLAVLAAAFVASYFGPTDPDSALFRSGSLSFLLLFALYFPVKKAVSTQPLRALFYGAGFAYAIMC